MSTQGKTWGMCFLVAFFQVLVYKYTMKINEVTKTNKQALFEELDSSNDTGYDTKVLVEVVEAHRADVWEELTDDAWEAMKKRILEKADAKNGSDI